MKKLSLAALFASTALIPAAVAQTSSNNVDVAAITDAKICGELVSYVNENDTDASGVTSQRANTIAEGQDPKICREAFLLAIGEKSADEVAAADMTKQGTADAEATANVKVAVPEPEVDVKQAAPQVSVDQPKPDVSVTPGRPIVTVNQAEPVVKVQTTPPTVTINMPKPEILVEMPNPNVQVSMAQPRVSVTQPKPTVDVKQGEVKLQMGNKQVDQEQGKAKVEVEQANATVRLNEAKGANVDVADVQPEVRYNAAKPRVEVSESGKPQIQFNQSGEANVRFRQMSEDETRQAAADQNSRMQTAQNDQGKNNAQDQARTKPMAAGQKADDTNAGMNTAARSQDQNREQQASAASTTDTNATMDAQGQRTTVSVQNLLNKALIGANGDAIGDVEDLVARGDQNYVVVGVGGLLGLGEKQVAVPLNEVYYHNDELVSPNLTEEAVDQMAEHNPDDYQPLGRDENIDMVVQ